MSVNSPLQAAPARRLAATAVIALAAGAGTAWALTGTGAPGTVLTTAQVVAKTDPGVVDVVSTLGYQRATSSGTGIVLSSSGEVLTNNHVIDGATSITVRDVGNGRTYAATVAGYDKAADIAVLRLRGASGLATAVLGNSASVKVGERVVAIGNALGEDSTPSAAAGTVTGLGQSITATDASAGTSEHLAGMIRSNADIQPGDSGGPLTSTSGQVIGIDTAGSTGSAYRLSPASGTQAFSIPISRALAVARQIEAGRSSASVHIGSTAFLGVEISSAAAYPAAPEAGALVVGTEPGSAAAAAGLAGGDTVTGLGGHAITSAAALGSALTAYHPGERVSITWTDQAGQARTATIVLTKGPAG